MNKTSPTPVQGFTLIEMTVVLLLITLLASVAIRETNSLSFQVRYEQTQERLERIREAILGNPRQIINGQQAISGFVADMGRLPVDLHELLEAQYCRPDREINWANNPTDADTVCNTNYGVGSWVKNDLFKNGYCVNNTDTTQADCENNLSQWIPLGFGWHGPYLNVSDSPADDDVFPDGWGRLASDKTDQNYGWRVTKGFDVNTAPPHPINNYRMVIQSYGKDHKADGADYDADYPSNRYSADNSAPHTHPAPLIDQEDWLVDISGGISVNIAKQFGANKFCGFTGLTASTPQPVCENAGGTWNGTACTFEQNSCKSVGGRWNSCFFTSSACSAAGGSPQTRCQFTEKSCNAAGGSGSWNTTNRTCLDLPAHQTNCENAGGSWNGTTIRCDFNESSCSLAGGAWVMNCEFTDATCPTDPPDVTWEGTIKPGSCNFTQTACTTLNGISLGNDYCYLSHGEHIGAKYNLTSCDAAGGSWTGKICLKIFYRNSNTSIVSISSNPVSIEENQGYQTVQFNFGTNPILIPKGQNAIGIYEYAGTECTSTLYPADRQNPIQLDFHPRTSLPVINW